MAKSLPPVIVPSVWALVRDPEDTCAVIADGVLDHLLGALEDASRRWAVSSVRRAVWARQRALQAAQGASDADD